MLPSFSTQITTPVQLRLLVTSSEEEVPVTLPHKFCNLQNHVNQQKLWSIISQPKTDQEKQTLASILHVFTMTK